MTETESKAIGTEMKIGRENMLNLIFWAKDFIQFEYLDPNLFKFALFSYFGFRKNRFLGIWRSKSQKWHNIF